MKMYVVMQEEACGQDIGSMICGVFYPREMAEAYVNYWQTIQPDLDLELTITEVELNIPLYNLDTLAAELAEEAAREGKESPMLPEAAPKMRQA
jgi:hypothetical protein